MKLHNKKIKNNNCELVLQIEFSETTGELFKRLEKIVTTQKLRKKRK